MAPRKKQSNIEFNSELFGDLKYVKPDDDSGAVKATKLDMYYKLLPAVHNVDYNFFDKITPEEIKGYEPYLVLRNMSQTRDKTHREFLLNTNDILNVDFWTLAEYPEFVHMLTCVISAISGGNKNTSHVYIPPKSKNSKNKLTPFFKTLSPSLNDDEIKILTSKMHYDEFKNILNSLGMQENEQKVLLKVFKEEAKK